MEEDAIYHKAINIWKFAIRIALSNFLIIIKAGIFLLYPSNKIFNCGIKYGQLLEKRLKGFKMPDIKGYSIHFPFLSYFLNVRKLTLCFTDVFIMISLRFWEVAGSTNLSTVRHKHMLYAKC